MNFIRAALTKAALIVFVELTIMDLI